MAAAGAEINLHWDELAPIFAKILAEHSERRGCVFRGSALSGIRAGLAELVEAQEIYCGGLPGAANAGRYL
jgi:hypothetical protein